MQNGVDQSRKMAGTAGFEPADEGVKVPCLTTWRRPNMVREKGSGLPDPLLLSGVGDGTRTHNARNHNPVLCQLNYTHHICGRNLLKHPQRELARQKGLEPLAYCLEGSCSIQLSYWRMLMEQVTGIEPASPAWKAGALTIVLHLRSPPGKCQLGYINM